MKVTGYQIREALRRANMRRSVYDKQFADSLWTFKGEDKMSPAQVAEGFRQADMDIATLQTMQQNFNLTVTVSVQGNNMSLAQAVKLIGGAGRLEKMWREAATGGKQDRYAYGESRKQRDADAEYATRASSVAESMKAADDAGRYASSLRDAVAKGNASTMEISKEFERLFA